MSCQHVALRFLGGGTCPACAPATFAAASIVKTVQGSFRTDGWQNTMTGIGTSADKRTGGGLTLSVVTPMEARDLWRGNDLAARVIESSPRDELQCGFQLMMDDKELAEQIMCALEEIPGPSFVGKGIKANVIKVRCFENAYGGGAIFPVINDAAGSLDQPLDEANIPTIDHLKIYEPRELRPTRWYGTDSAKAGEPSHYQVLPITGVREGMIFVEIHETRLILFPGIRVTRAELVGAEYGWGDNKLTRVRDVLNDFELTFGSAANLLQDFSQAVLKLDGLAALLGQDGQNEAGARLSEMNRWRSVLRAVVIDSKDSFTRETTSLAGLPEMMDRFMFRLAAAAEMPVSKLMGMAPAGLNATGEADAANWHSVVANGQEHTLPRLERLIKLFMLAKDSPTKGVEPDVWSVEFSPLNQPSEKETAETRKIVMETDCGYIDRGVFGPEEIARARAGGDTYSMELAIDFEARDAHQEAIDRATAAGASTTADPTTTNASAGVKPIDAAKAAFNGAQVSSMVEVVKAAIAGDIPRPSAAAILEIAFPINAAQALKLLGPENFEAPAKAPAPLFGAPGNPPPAPPVPPVPNLDARLVTPAPGHQEKPYSCGAAALVNVCTALGMDVTEAKVRELAGTNETGTGEQGIIDAAHALGLVEKVRTTGAASRSWTQLRADLVAGHPCILCVDQWDHWVALIGLMGDRVILQDSTNTAENIQMNGIHLMTQSELIDRWQYRGEEKSLYSITFQQG